MAKLNTQNENQIEVLRVSTTEMLKLFTFKISGKTKHYFNDEHNAAVIFKHDPAWKGKFKLNVMTGEILVDDKLLNPYILTDIKGSIAKRYHLNYSGKDTILLNAITYVAHQHSFHPVQDYLNGLAWDGESRIITTLTSLGIDPTPLHQAYLSTWLVGAVNRAMEPGCQNDYVLVLQGSEGIGKSTFFKTLGGNYFRNDEIHTASKDGSLLLRHTWIYELADAGRIIKDGKYGEVKAFITRMVDNVRPPYGTAIESYPRTVALGATINPESVLTDEKGGDRRFHILPCGKVVKKEMETWLRENRDQIWAEAINMRANGAVSYLSVEQEEERKEANEPFRVISPLEDRIGECMEQLEELAKSSEGGRGLTIYQIAQALEAGEENSKLNLMSNDYKYNQIGGIMRAFGWTKTRIQSHWDKKVYWSKKV